MNAPTLHRWTLLGAICAISACGSATLAPAASLPDEPPITDSERDHWAYRPITIAEPPATNDSRFGHHPVDRFVKAAWDEAELEPLPRAGKATLARRLWFDLTGLPPTPSELQAFLNDQSPDAYEQLVDRLLASPEYGERWAQHWLDLARFAETDGFEHDLERPNAWRYRDWVIDALNRDMPFDEFVRLQVAGDLLRSDDRNAAIATGFLLCGPDMPDLNLQEERRHVVLNEMTSTVGAVFLAMQFGCAQCHDHKFDPIRQYDFYRLRAFFEPSEIFRDHPVPTDDELAAREAAEANRPAEELAAEERRKELESLGRTLFREQNPDVIPSTKMSLAKLSEAEREEHARLVELLKNAKPLPALSHGRVMQSDTSHEAHFYLRGDFRRTGPLVECGLPRVLESADSAANQRALASDSPRVALAEWLTSADNPLTARVIVNRLWQWHFGAGISANASDFGLMGNAPSHPELLDWLADRFTSDGWSMKRMHRLLVTSETYRLASGPFDPQWTHTEITAAESIWQSSHAHDPENGLIWHHRRQRLDGEAIRDAMLVASDRLSTRRRGPGIRPPLAPEVTETLLRNQWKVNGDEEDHRRRSIYLFVRRNLRYPMFDVYDRPDTMASCALRHESTTATQSLTQFNSAFSLDCARWLAGAVLSGEPSIGREHIEAVYQRLVSRHATSAEVDDALKFIERQAAALREQGRVAGSTRSASSEPTRRRSLHTRGPRGSLPGAAQLERVFVFGVANLRRFRQLVPELVALGLDVPGVVLVDRRLDGDLVDHLQVEPAVDEGVGLLGIVGEQADLRQPEILEELNADAIVARVGFVSQRQVGFHRVEPFVLQRVGLDLLDQADAAALLRQINQHAGAFLGDHLQGHVELIATIAAQRSQHVARETGRVQAYQRHASLVRFAHHQREWLLRFVLHSVEDELEHAMPGGQPGLGDAIDQFFAHAAIADQLLDRDDLHLVLFGQFEEPAARRPVAIGVEDFA